MTTTHEVRGRLIGTTRLNSSVNGNPRFSLAIENSAHGIADLATGVDYAVGYEVSNYRTGRMVVLTVDDKGRVVGMRYARRTTADR